jgi:hypothetical protein
MSAPSRLEILPEGGSLLGGREVRAEGGDGRPLSCANATDFDCVPETRSFVDRAAELGACLASREGAIFFDGPVVADRTWMT